MAAGARGGPEPGGHHARGTPGPDGDEDQGWGLRPQSSPNAGNTGVRSSSPRPPGGRAGPDQHGQMSTPRSVPEPALPQREPKEHARTVPTRGGHGVSLNSAGQLAPVEGKGWPPAGRGVGPRPAAVALSGLPTTSRVPRGDAATIHRPLPKPPLAPGAAGGTGSCEPQCEGARSVWHQPP